MFSPHTPLSSSVEPFAQNCQSQNTLGGKANLVDESTKTGNGFHSDIQQN
jgi:hypothetical protein